MQLKNNSSNHHIHAKQATIYKGGKKIRKLQEGGKEWELTKRKEEWFWEDRGRRNNKSKE